MITETDRKGLIGRPKYFPQEHLNIPVVLLQKPVLTAADIDDQPETQRQIRSSRKELNGLRNAVFQHFKLFLADIVLQAAVC